MKSTNSGVERWQSIQNKYENSQEVINKQLTALEELNDKVSQLKDINNQLEYSWSQKYKSNIADHETEVMKIKKDADESLQKCELENEQKIKELKTQFRDDVMILDKELNKQSQ